MLEYPSVWLTNRDGSFEDITRWVTDISLTLPLFGSAGKMSVGLNPLGKSIGMGQWVRLRDPSNKTVFNGFVTKESFTNDSQELEVQDVTRFLDRPVTLVVPKNGTLGWLLTTVGNILGVQFKLQRNTGVVLPEKVHDNTSAYSVIKWALEYVSTAENKLWFLRTVDTQYQVLTPDSSPSNLLFSSNSNITKWAMSSALANDTYNKITVYTEDSKTKKRQSAVAKDDNLIKLWGTWEKVEKLDNVDNPAQLKSRADSLLKVYKNLDRTFKVSALGDFRVKPGQLVRVDLPDAKVLGLNPVYHPIVKTVNHRITHSSHTMDLELSEPYELIGAGV